jgi:hypothetical protein
MALIEKLIGTILTAFGLACAGGILAAAITLIGLGSEAMGMPSWAWGVWVGSSAVIVGCAALTGRWLLVLNSIAGLGIFVVFGVAGAPGPDAVSDEFARLIQELARAAAWGGLTVIPLLGALNCLAALGKHRAGSSLRPAAARNAGDSRW